MQVELLFSGMAISNLERSAAWYERIFGRPADVNVSEIEVMWRLAAKAGWLYIVVDPARVGRGIVALSVADLDDALSELAERGIEPDTLERVGSSSERKATFSDPDGNVVALISVPAG